MRDVKVEIFKEDTLLDSVELPEHIPTLLKWLEDTDGDDSKVVASYLSRDDKREVEYTTDSTKGETLESLRSMTLEDEEAAAALSVSLNSLMSLSNIKGVLVVAVVGDARPYALGVTSRVLTPTKDDLKMLVDTTINALDAFKDKVSKVYGVTFPGPDENPIILP